MLSLTMRAQNYCCLPGSVFELLVAVEQRARFLGTLHASVYVSVHMLATPNNYLGNINQSEFTRLSYGMLHRPQLRGH